MTKVEYTLVIKDGLLHIPDQYVTLAEAAKFLGISRQKLEKLIAQDMVIWEQPKNRVSRFVEKKSLARLKHPEIIPSFEPLTVKDGKALQAEIDAARHKIASAASLPPGAIKIFFDMDGK